MHSPDHTIADNAVDHRVSESAKLTIAKRQGGRVNLTDLISARKGERSARAEARAQERKDAQAQAEMEHGFACAAQEFNDA